MSDYLQKYLPEYDDDSEREKLAGFSREDLLDMLIIAYKQKRLLAKMLDEETKKLSSIREALDQPSKLRSMLDVPGPDDLRKLMV